MRVVLLLALLVPLAGCATRWDGEASVVRFRDRVSILSLPRVERSQRPFWWINPCHTTDAVNERLRASVPEHAMTSCASIVVDLEAEPPNFYIASRSTPIGGPSFRFLGAWTLEACERIRAQRTLRSDAADGYCQPAVLTIH